ncbi:MAG: hypothetical protein R2815_10260 [Flavobacteriales bacterium]
MIPILFRTFRSLFMLSGCLVTTGLCAQDQAVQYEYLWIQVNGGSWVDIVSVDSATMVVTLDPEFRKDRFAGIRTGLRQVQDHERDGWELYEVLSIDPSDKSTAFLMRRPKR